MDLSQKILSDITVYSKYARYLPELKRRETWIEIVDRNKAMHVSKFPKLKDEIENNYKLVYEYKSLPSMRSLQFAGKPITLAPNRIYNCCFCPMDDYECFSEIFFLLLGGSGVGFSVQNCHINKLPEIRAPRRGKRFLISDSIAGWSDSIKVLMKAYFFGSHLPLFDFSDIREKGAILKTSGGRAPGPEPLMDCLHNVKKILDRKSTSEKLNSFEIHQIVCFIADAVLAGGIRRAALLSLFSFDDERMLSCKSGNWLELYPHLARANNSACILRHRIKKAEFFDAWKRIELSRSGEPALYFSQDRDWGLNPCAEIGLRPYQFCNLTEINVSDIESQEDLNNRARVASFLGTLQASYTDFHYLRPIWKETTEKDSLLGVGMTGICSGKILDLDLAEAATVVKDENERVAKVIGINKAARCTTIKPSGTSSCVLGCSSGIHAWHDSYYIRRIKLLKNEALYKYLLKNLPKLIEDDYFKPSTEAIFMIPQKSPDGSILRPDEKVIKMLERVKRFNIEWVREGHRNGHNPHNVSATVSLHDNEWDKVGEWLWENRDYYNGLSFFPQDCGNYPQAPFESITKKRYEELYSYLDDLDLSKVKENTDNTNLKGELACAGGACELT